MVARPLVETARNTMLFSEIVTLALDSFRSSKWRFALTALGMVIGTASLIVVVTIGLTGKQYVMNQIQGIGANLIYAYYEGGSNASVSTSMQRRSDRGRHARRAAGSAGNSGCLTHDRNS